MMFARAVPNKQPIIKTYTQKVVIMEYESKNHPVSLKELLGKANKPGETEVGIINEAENWIHRRALDYLMVGFVTDADQVESRKEERYEEYIDTIEGDLEQYYKDVFKWNTEHLQNAIPATWQTEYDYKTGREVRRVDLPSVEVCKASIVNLGQYRDTPPSRQDVKSAATEGLELYYDEALKESCNLLSKRLEEIAGELPTAPYEAIEGEDVMTHDELLAEQKAVNSRLNAAEKIYLERHPQDGIGGIGGLVLPNRNEVTLNTGPTYVIREMGKVGTTLVRTDKQ
jgi:hypothetical protein